MWNLVTLEGFFEGPKKWDLDWHEYVWGDELEQLSLEQGETADALLFGRVTYEGMAAYWPSAKGEVADWMNSVPKVVFSRTLDKASWNNTKVVKGNLAAEIRKLKKELGGPMTILGSGSIVSQLAQEGLIDEYSFAVNPVVLGEGRTMFDGMKEKLALQRTKSRTFGNGNVVLSYEPTTAGA